MKNDDVNKSAQEYQDNNLNAQSKAFLQILRNRGIVADQDISNEKIREAEKERRKAMFHNTEVMLKN